MNQMIQKAMQIPLGSLSHHILQGLNTIGVLGKLGTEAKTIDQIAQTLNIKNTHLLLHMMYCAEAHQVVKSDSQHTGFSLGDISALKRLMAADDAMVMLVELHEQGRLATLGTPTPIEECISFKDRPGFQMLIGQKLAHIDNVGIMLEPEFVQVASKIMPLMIYFAKLRRPRNWQKFGDFLMGEFIQPWNYADNEWTTVMAGISTVTAPVAKVFPPYFDEDGVTSVLDLGGGTGVFSLMLKQAFNKLEITVADVPQVTALVNTPLLMTKELNLATDEIPPSDAYLLNNVLHTLGDDVSIDILKRIPGGQLYIVDFMLGANPPSVILSTEFITTAGGECGNRTLEQFAVMLDAGGWKMTGEIAIDGTAAHLIKATK